MVVPKLKADSLAAVAGERNSERSWISPCAPQLQASCMAPHDHIAVLCSNEQESMFGHASNMCHRRLNPLHVSI